jgi:hypothetical protein
VAPELPENPELPKEPELLEVEPEPLELDPRSPEGEPEPLPELPDPAPERPEVEPAPVPSDCDCDPDVTSELDPDGELQPPSSEELPDGVEHAAKATMAVVGNGRKRALMIGALPFSCFHGEALERVVADPFSRPIFGTNRRE